MEIPLMGIRIGMDPDMFDIGNFVLTWHGFMTFISVALAVVLVGRWAKKEGLDTDAVYSVAVWAIIGGILGARLVHVIDFWNSFYRHDLLKIVQIWSGGISIYGAILGGFALGGGYILLRNHPRFLALWNSLGAKLQKAPLPSVGRLADITAPALLIGMALGRIGDIINGEHFAKTTDYPWALTYSHPDTAALYASNGLNSLTPTHPAVVYEMLWDIAVLALIWPLRNRLRPHGMLFALYLGVYSLGKFFIHFLRMDKEWVVGLTEAQIIAIILLAVTVPLLLLKAQFVREAPAARAPRAGAGGKG